MSFLFTAVNFKKFVHWQFSDITGITALKKKWERNVNSVVTYKWHQ